MSLTFIGFRAQPRGRYFAAGDDVWLSLHHSPYPPSRLAVSQDQSILSRESQEATVRILNSLHSMKMRFETPSNCSKPPALRSLQTANRESITISPRTAFMGFRTWP